MEECYFRLVCLREGQSPMLLTVIHKVISITKPLLKGSRVVTSHSFVVFSYKMVWTEKVEDAQVNCVTVNCFQHLDIFFFFAPVLHITCTYLISFHLTLLSFAHSHIFFSLSCCTLATFFLDFSKFFSYFISTFLLFILHNVFL